MRICKYIYTIIAIVGVCSVQAQNDSISEDLTKTIKVYSEPKVQLSDAMRISVNPKAYDTLDLRVDLDYIVHSEPVPTTYKINQLKAVSVKGDKLPELYRGEASLGIGNYNALYANLRYMTERSRKKQLGIDAYHNSSFGKVKLDNKEKVPANFTQSYIKLHGKKFTNKLVMYGSVKPKYESYLLYGGETDTLLLPNNIVFDTTTNKKDLRRNVFSVNAKAGVSSKATDLTEFRHNTFAEYDFTWLEPKRMENLVAVSTFGKKEFESFNIGYTANANWTSINFNPADTTLEKNYLQTVLFPYIGISRDDWDVQLGVKLSHLFMANKFKPYPDFKAQYTLYNNALVPFLSYSGNYTTYSLKDILIENPYINDNIMLRPCNTKRNFQVGVKGLTTIKIPYSVSFSAQSFKDMHFWVNDAIYTDTLQNTFNAVYYDASRFSLNIETGIQNKKLNLNIGAKFHKYVLDTLEYAWHKPSIEANLTLKYNVINSRTNKNKLVAKAEILLQSKRYAYDPILNEAVKMNTIADLNVGLQYIYNSSLIIFLDVNNVTATKYNNFYLYPAQRINAMLGVTYSFSGVK